MKSLSLKSGGPTVGCLKWRLLLFLGGLALSLAGPGAWAAMNLPMDDSAPLRLPQVGDHQLRLFSSNIVELLLITTKAPDPAPVTQWNFVDANGNFTPPALSEFAVTANGQPVAVQAVGFKRRALYADLLVYDLRIANYLYLRLAQPVATGALLQVRNPSGNLWASNVLFTLTVDPLRYSPAIHVNQVGYLPTFPKKAIVGYYLGNWGELTVASAPGFQLIATQSSNVVYQGMLVLRQEAGYHYTPPPYQQVLEADFSAFQTPGQYKLVVPGLGASLPFLIDDRVGGTFARTYELGIYHQRCGTSNALPFTRFVHGPCHTNKAQVPTLASPEFDFANAILNQQSWVATNNSLATAPRMTNVAASLFPFVNTGSVDVSGGHHDAGDYSKYTIDVALLIHYLTFAVDAFPGVKNLDNLGIPESGDGISDLLQEAKWEADFLAKMQDADGGFYFNVYPKNRQYEYDVLPDHGDPQIVMPKNTSATAAAVAALAEIGSSPTFKAAYPAVAASYLSKAQSGWAFLQRAITKYGRNGCYQAEAYMGNDFMHNDELAWAAAALYAATANAAYDTDLRTYTPNPNDPSLRLWGWWNMYAGYGCAFRDYAFAARTGRLQASQLNATYLAQCLAEIKTAATNALLWSVENAYGTSFPDENKPILTGAWYFATEKAFDPAVAYQIDPQPAYLDVVLRNFNYELGCNPVNITFATGLGWKRQRQIVNQYAENDYRVLPPSGIPLGNIQQGFSWLALYGATLGNLSYPLDGAAVPYPMNDRWGDAWNGITESVVSQQASRAAGTAAWLMAQANVRTQAWKSATAQISGLPALVQQNQTVTATVTAPGLDLTQAAIVWEALDQEPALSPSFNFLPGNIGTNWVEVEAQLPDGRRVFAVTNFFALPTNPPPPLAVDADMVALYRLDTNYVDVTGQQPNLTVFGAAALDPIGLRVQALGDNVQVNVPNPAVYTPSKTQAISVEANFYINHFNNPADVGQCYLLELFQTYTTELVLFQQAYQARPDVYGGGNIILSGDILTNTLTFNQWHAFNMTISKTGYTVSVDGVPVFSNSSGDLANWLGSGQILLRAGDFDGWIRNLVVRNIQPRQPIITSWNALANGNFQFGLNAQGSIGYSVLASVDFTNWTRIGGFTQSVSGPFQYIDNGASKAPVRFYRLRIP